MSATAFDDVLDLYQEVILDRGRRPRHGSRLMHYDASAKGDNPMCGDRVEVYVNRRGDGRLAEVGFVARGCAISIASADLMADAVIDRSREEVGEVFDRLSELLRTGQCSDCDEALSGLMPLGGVHSYPSRLKCATLPWHALLAALDGRSEATSE